MDEDQDYIYPCKTFISISALLHYCLVFLSPQIYKSMSLAQQSHKNISSTLYDRSTKHTKFDLSRVRTHDLQIITAHFMSLRCLTLLGIRMQYKL